MSERERRGATEPGAAPRNPIFFATPPELRDWFAVHAGDRDELWVGFHRVGSGLTSIRWPQAVDEALCVGWIDGKRVGVNAESYANRFTPRRRGSTWSAVNVAKVEALIREGRMQPAGMRAFEARTGSRTAIYSYEQVGGVYELPPEALARFKADAAAWEWWERQPRSYRRPASWWVVSAKRPETRERRLATLIEDSAAGRKIKPLQPTGTRIPDAE